jgi:hypothetical protein
MLPRGADERLRGEIVDLVGFGGPQGSHHGALIRDVVVEQRHVVDHAQVVEAIGRRQAGAAVDAVDLVPFAQQELGKVRPVLPRDPGDQCPFHALPVYYGGPAVVEI